MIHLLASADRNPWLGVGGNLHPAIVHFPIALLSVAALFEGIQILRKRPELAPGTRMITVLAAVSACVASLLGWFNELYSETSGETFDLHKWIGLGTTAVAVAAALLSIKATSCRGSLIAMRLALILGAGMVGATGYLGGELVYGKDHITGPLTKKAPDEKAPLLIPASNKVSFEKEIAPLIKDMCFKCHGGEKIKGKLELNTKALAMKGGQGGKFINPGKPPVSSFYSSLIADPDSDQYMPPPKEKVRPTKEQIERVRKWIEEGADWPDGYEFKK